MIMNIPSFDRQLIFILFLSLGVSFYLWKFNEPVNDYSLFTIKGVLKEEPYWSSTGGDFTYEYVKISLIDGNHFDLRNCAYKAANLDKIHQLIAGDTILFQVDSLFVDKKEHYVFSLRSNKNGNILLVEDLNRCELNRWTVTFYIAIIILGWLLLRLIIRLIKRFYNFS